MSDITIKKGDTWPPAEATLLDAEGTPIDLTGASVKFSMRPFRGALKIDKATCEIVSAEAGTVKYQWQASDTDTTGTFRAEFEVTFQGGGVITVPNKGDVEVEISDSVN